MRNSSSWLAITSVGFGLALSLNAFTLWGIQDLLSPASAWPWAASEMGAFCLPANVLTFLAYGLLAARWPALSQRRPSLPAGALLLLGGAALLAACTANAPGLPLFQLAGALLGAGGALAFVCWELAFAAGGLRDARRSILVASAFSAVPYLLLMLFAHDIVVFPLVCVLVPCTVLMLAIGARKIPLSAAGDGRQSGPGGDDSNAHRPQSPDWRGLWSDLWAPLGCTMMVGVIGPAIGTFATLESIDDALRSLLYQFANVAAVAVLALCWFRFKAQPTIELVFLTLVPVAVVVLFLFPFWSQGYQGFALAFGCFMFNLVSILMMMRCIELARGHGVGLGCVYGLFAAGTYLAQVLGGQLAGIVGTSAYPRQFQVIAVVVLLLWGLSALAIVAMWRIRTARRPSGGKDAGQSVVPRAEPAPSAPPSKNAPDAVARHCEALRRAHGLTPREAEVLELLGRGRDVGAIAEMLGVSRNTVRTHVQRLYTDLGVHTRQELIDLLESADGA